MPLLELFFDMHGHEMVEGDLFLMRHAKAEAHSPTGRDEDRPLSTRGLAQCKIMHDKLAPLVAPALTVLCSCAVRTRQTATTLGLKGAEIAYRDDLYLASAEALWQALLHCPQRPVLLIAHNPGLRDLNAALVQSAEGEPHLRQADTTRFPTAWVAHYRVTRSSGHMQLKLNDFIVSDHP